ncbi:MAG: VPLPA-CTERM sorting domain-containing protein [Gammaproteobacteria bacterium]|nr:VPLPA-CTERM sorting domain-containing protein [Gammaproteobacteria bacterium]MBV8404653.1 VPLPA-CTERM sorting domain-containing protein [Gammaproteobacteria bacterium]
MIGLMGLLGAMASYANTLTYTGGNCPAGCSITGSGTGPNVENFGSLTPPTTVTFSDQNLTAGQTVIDQWEFSVPQSVFSGTVTGEQINLNNFTISGTVDTFDLYSGTPGSGTLIAGDTVSGSFNHMILATLLAGGNYYLQVQATDGSSSSGFYAGGMVLAPVPLPASAWLLMSALGGLALLGTSRRRVVALAPA